jgi:DNA invertase Pin-like site-specific DNA recombinase
MIQDAEQGKIDLILTKEVSRFARNTIDTLSYTRRLSALGVGAIFTNDGIDTRDKDGELRLTIMASIAQEESRKTSERSKWGIQRKMEGGFVFGHDLLGFKKVNGVLEIKPKEAKLVKRMFNMYLYEKMSLSSIAKVLNTEGILSKKGNIWRGETVGQILTNKKYVGDLAQGVYVVTDYLTGRRVMNYNTDSLICIPNHHEGIVSREVWDGVQAQLKERGGLKQKGKKYSRKNWFSNKVACGKCGWSYNVGGASKKDTYNRSLTCRNRQCNGNEIKTAVNGKQLGCDGVAINEVALKKSMKFVLEHIQTSRKEIVKDMLDEIKLMQQADEPIDTAPLEAEIENNIRKKRKTYDLMLDEVLSKEDLLAQSAFYDGEIARLTEEINQAQNQTSAHKTQIEKVKARITEINKTAETDADNTNIYSELVEKFIVNDGNVTVYLKCMPVGFMIFYHVLRQNIYRKYDVVIDTYEIVE